MAASRTGCRTTWVLRWEQQGFTDSANAPLLRIAELQRGARDCAGLAVSLQHRGWMKITAGDYGAGRSDLLESIRVGRTSRNLSPVAWAELGLSSLALSLGDMAGTPGHGAAAESLMVAQGDQIGLILANRVHVARPRGDSATARQLAVRYRETVRRFGAI